MLYCAVSLGVTVKPVGMCSVYVCGVVSVMGTTNGSSTVPGAAARKYCVTDPTTSTLSRKTRMVWWPSTIGVTVQFTVRTLTDPVLVTGTPQASTSAGPTVSELNAVNAPVSTAAEELRPSRRPTAPAGPVGPVGPGMPGMPCAPRAPWGPATQHRHCIHLLTTRTSTFRSSLPTPHFSPTPQPGPRFGRHAPGTRPASAATRPRRGPSSAP
jgi:hypothetical protein